MGEPTLVDEGLTVCLFCDARFRGACGRSLHWDAEGRCLQRPPVVGELVEDRRGLLRPVSPSAPRRPRV